MPFTVLEYSDMVVNYALQKAHYCGQRKVEKVEELPDNRRRYIYFVDKVFFLLDNNKFPSISIPAVPGININKEKIDPKAFILTGMIYLIASMLHNRNSDLAYNMENVILGAQTLDKHAPENNESLSTDCKLKMIPVEITNALIQAAGKFYNHNIFIEGKASKGRMQENPFMHEADIKSTNNINFKFLEKCLVKLAGSNTAGIYSKSSKALEAETKALEAEAKGHQRSASLFSALSSIFGPKKQVPKESIFIESLESSANVSENLDAQCVFEAGTHSKIGPEVDDAMSNNQLLNKYIEDMDKVGSPAPR